MSEDAPKAKVARRRGPSPVWLAPIVAGALAGYIVHKKVVEEGPTVTISFHDATGIKKGSDAKYLGVKIGEVMGVAVSKDLDRILVEVRLDRSASELARRESLFWIARPELSGSGVSGLSTIVSGSYVGIKPGGGPKTDHFIGRETAPIEKTDERDLEVVLTEDRMGNVQEGTAIYYRGIRVGAVRTVKLAEDARGVVIDALIFRSFVPLVRANTRFWDAGELRLRVGLLSGVQVGAKSLGALISGGLALATPDPPGAPVKDGHVFSLAPKPGKGWTDWKPAIPLPKPSPEPAQP